MPENDMKAPSTNHQSDAPNSERREALIKLGKYAAYASPIVLGSVSGARGAPISGIPAPTPPPP